MTTEQMALQQVSENIEYYHQLQEEASRIELSLDIVKKSIIDGFGLTGMREYTTGTGIKAWVDMEVLTVRQLKERE